MTTRRACLSFTSRSTSLSTFWIVGRRLHRGNEATRLPRHACPKTRWGDLVEERSTTARACSCDPSGIRTRAPTRRVRAPRARRRCRCRRRAARRRRRSRAALPVRSWPQKSARASRRRTSARQASRDGRSPAVAPGVAERFEHGGVVLDAVVGAVAAADQRAVADLAARGRTRSAPPARTSGAAAAVPACAGSRAPSPGCAPCTC